MTGEEQTGEAESGGGETVHGSAAPGGQVKRRTGLKTCAVQRDTMSATMSPESSSNTL